MKQTMKKIGLATGVLVMAGTAVPTAGEGLFSKMAPVEAKAASVTYKTTDSLNLRTDASTKSKVLLTIPKGKTVSHVATKASWTKVKYGSKTGWVATKYLKKDIAVQKATTSSVSMTTTTNLNMRSGASTKSGVIITIPANKVVTEISRNGSWSQVKYGTKTGWVSNQYLKKTPVVAPAPKPAPKPVTPAPKPVKPAPTPTPAPKPTTPVVTPPVPTTPVTPTAPAVTVTHKTTENLNMRIGSGTNYAIITTIPKGAEVGVSSTSKGWSKVTYSGKTGFVSSSYLVELENKVSTTVTPYAITLSQMVDKQFSLNAQTDKYRNAPAYVAKSLIKADGLNGTTLDIANVRSEMNTTSHIYGVIPKGSKVSIVKAYTGFYQVNFSTWRNAKKEDILPVLDPSKVSPDSKEYFQFLDLSKPAGVTVNSMNKVLTGRGILSGEGDAFIQASKEHNVNEIYLASHAMLETGNGTSQLSKGVLVTQVDGQPVEPKVVYNMYGIGAIDSAPLKGGSETAYKNGWFTPEAAIIGGAKFIGERYVNNPTYKQNTLYKMRWNPAQPGTHQYATDIGWAVKQVPSIYNLYQLLDDYTLSFDVPTYTK